MGDPRAILADVFGFDSFRPGQEEIVEDVIAGRNTLAIMPTGGGKSLCYQLPALCRDGVTVVISPLIALMRDQVRALRNSGVAAGALTSGNTEEETEDVQAALRGGDLQLLYMAPERLAGSGTAAFLKRIGCRAIAVDEAHCVSQWGHDFRPDYLRIGDLRRSLGVPLAAFTATADQETRDEIVERLFDGVEPALHLRGFDRPNIRLAFAEKDQPRKQITAFAAARKGLSGIVYCATRAKTETLARALGEAGHSACAYHGGMEPEARREVERRFGQEDGLIVVATVAFGMGVDKPDVRWVAHADLPKSIEAYYQEIGRAGRDGAPADTLTLYGSDDIRLRRSQIDEGLAGEDRKSAEHGRLNMLLGLAEAQGCRRRILLGHFGEDSGPCGNCDLCEHPPELFDGTIEVQKALSAVLRTGEWFGAGHIVDILTGTATDKIRARGHDALPTFGVGKETSRPEWRAILLQMLGQDFVRPDPARHGALRIMPAARGVLRGETKVSLRRVHPGKRPKPEARALVNEEDAPLFAALKARRRALAESQKLPAYMVFPDRTLIEMAQTRPTSLDGLARINGVGARKLERYGAVFLEVLSGEPAELPHPARKRMAGRPEAALYDRLLAAQTGLIRGACGTLKPMTCSASQLAKVAGSAGADAATIERLLGPKKAERFGLAFLDILRAA